MPQQVPEEGGHHHKNAAIWKGTTRTLTLGDAHGTFGIVEEDTELSQCDHPLQEWSDNVTGAFQDLISLRYPMITV